MILEVIDAVVEMGGTQDAATERLGLSKRTVERWRSRPEDLRQGPKSEPENKLRVSAHRGHRDRRIVDTEIGTSWTPRSPHRGRRDRPIVDTEIGSTWTVRSLVLEIGRSAD